MSTPVEVPCRPSLVQSPRHLADQAPLALAARHGEAEGSESEPPAESRSSRRRTRPVAWSDKPALDVPELARPTQAEVGERRCCLDLLSRAIWRQRPAAGRCVAPVAVAVCEETIFALTGAANAS